MSSKTCLTNEPKMIGAALLLAALLAAPALSRAAPNPNPQLQQATAWLAAGKGAAAFELLLPLTDTMAGEPAFDGLMGAAALAADQPTLALLAFERCLLVAPTAQCRLGLARAHLQLGEIEPAYDQLVIVQQAGGSAEYAAVLAEYESLLSKRNQTIAARPRFSLWLQTGVGYDSNVNTATDNQNIYVPNYGIMDLEPEWRRRDSFFQNTRLGLNYSVGIAPNWQFLADGTLAYTNYWSMHDYDALTMDLSLGLRHLNGPHRSTIRAFGQYYGLGGYSYRSLGGLLGQYSYALDDKTELGGFLQYTRQHYMHFNEYDSNRGAAGLSWSLRVLDNKAIVYSSLYGGRQHGTHDASPASVNYNFLGVRLGAALTLGSQSQIDGGVSLEGRKYSQPDSLMLDKRHDKQYSAWLGLTHKLNRQLSLRPMYSYTYSDSSHDLRDYSRHVISVNLRYEFF